MAAYIAFQGFQLASIWGMMSSKAECEEAIVEALQTASSADLNRTSKKIDTGCARLEANADMAERMMRRLP